MADYVEIPIIAAGTGVKILTDDITQLNSSTVPSVPAQRQKAGWGADGVFNDVSVASPFPITVIGTPQTTALAYGSVSVGTSSVQLPANANLQNGVNLKSKAANGGTINIGGNSSVTTTTGFELSAGNATFQAVSNSNQLWAIGSAGTQILNYTCS